MQSAKKYLSSHMDTILSGLAAISILSWIFIYYKKKSKEEEIKILKKMGFTDLQDEDYEPIVPFKSNILSNTFQEPKQTVLKARLHLKI